MTDTPVRIGLFGAGDWGRNLVRNFAQLPGSALVRVCDPSEKRLADVKRQYPSVDVTDKPEAVLDDPSLQAVVIAAPAKLHADLARRAMEKGRHVFIEKPMALSVADAEALVALADARKCVLQVGHLLEYHPAVEYLQSLVASGELGEIFYVYSQRLNLGRIRGDENALWSFAPHDISVLMYLLGEVPVSASAHGSAYLQDGIEDVVFVNLAFPGKRRANIHLSWLDPHKIRKFTLVGSKKMAVFDDMEGAEKIRIYDKGAQVGTGSNPLVDFISLRFGDIRIPQIPSTEPLRNECLHFLDCVRTGKTPRSDGRDGLRVVRVLAAAQKSLEQGGVPVKLA